MKKAFKTIRGIILIIVIIFFILISSSVILGFIYKEEIKKYVITELNKEIEVKIQVRSIDLSVIRKFPYISIVLSDAMAFSGHNFEKQHFTGIETDTLFVCSKIYLQFNLIDFINKDYRIKKIHLQTGKVNLYTDRYGLTNYRLFKHEPKAGKNPVSISLDGVKITGFSWKYINLSKDIRSGGYLNDIVLKGRFSSRDFTLNTEGSFVIDNFNRESVQFADRMNIGLKVNMDVVDSVYKITEGDLLLNDMNFRILGSFATGHHTKLDLKFETKGTNINTLISSLPFDIGMLKQIKPSGKVDLVAEISGDISGTKVPNIHAAFILGNGKITLRKSGEVFENIRFRGTYTNGIQRSVLSSSIKLTEFAFISGKSNLKGNLSVENFIRPYVRTSFSGKIDGRYLSEIFSIPGFNIEQGFIHPDISIDAILNNIKNTGKNKIASISMNGNFHLDSISGKLPGVSEYIDNLKGDIKVEGDTWYPDLFGKTGLSDIKINLQADHVLGYFLQKNTSLWIKGELYSQYLDLKKIIKGNSSGDSTLNSLFPQKLYMKFNYAADSLIYGKFRAKNISAFLDYKPGVLTVSGLNLTTMRGRIITNGIITEELKEKFSVKSESKLEKIDINDLFYTFNNFAQSFIVRENLKGLISGNLQLNIFFNNNFEPDFSTLTANSDIIIANGELVNFEPIKTLSGYVKVSELEHIKFSTLQNSVVINNSKVFIPQMDIKSSAFNITTSGTHNFDNYFEYKLKVNLSEILTAKFQKARKDIDDFGVVENDGQGGANIFLSIIGTPEDYKVKYDKRFALINIRKDLEKEKTVLKSILKDEFGMFKKDSVKNTQVNKTDDKFIMDWGEEEKKPDEIKKNSKNTTDESKFGIIWDEN